MTLKQRSAEKVQVDIDFNYFSYFVSLHKSLYIIYSRPNSPRAGNFGDFFRQRLCDKFPLTLSNLIIGLSCTRLRSSLNVSFFCPSTPSSHPVADPGFWIRGGQIS